MIVMPYRCLSEFLEELGHAGELSRVEEAIDADLELVDHAARSAAEGGGSLLFVSVKGHDMPLAANLLAAEGRIRRALGGEPLDAVAARLERLLDNSAPEGWLERIKTGGQPAAFGALAPRKVRAAACQQIVRLGGDVDLGELPLPQCAAEETGRSIYAAAVVTAEPDSIGRFGGGSTCSGSTVAAGRCWASYDRMPGCWRISPSAAKMPLAVVVGCDPAFPTSRRRANAADTDVCALAGFLRQKPIDSVACRGVDLEVPAEAEIVIEGFADPAEPPVAVGPTLAPLGHLTRPRSAAAMHVAAVTHRANPIFAAYIPGRPPHEICTVARAMHRVFLPLLKLSMPELVDFDLPEFAAARHWAVVSIDKTYPGQGRRAAHAAWGLRPIQFAKTLIVVDADVEPRDRDQVLAAIAKNFRPEMDLITERFPADPYDPMPPTGELTERIAIDATRKR